MGSFDAVFGPPTREKFAEALRTAIKNVGETSPIRYDAEQFRLHVEGEDEHHINLGNLYEEYCRCPIEEREAYIANLARAWFSSRLTIPDEFEQAKENLLPVVRSRIMFELYPQTLDESQRDRFDWSFTILTDSLGVALVYDLPSAMTYVQKHTLASWQTTFEVAFAVARQNLAGITQQRLSQVVPGVWASPWKDNYDASRMLLTDYVRQHDVKGDPVVMVPNRDMLLLTGSEDDKGLGIMAEIAESAVDHPRYLCGMVYRLDANDRWQAFIPDANHPHSNTFRLLQLESLGRGLCRSAGVVERDLRTNRATGVRRQFFRRTVGRDWRTPQLLRLVERHHQLPAQDGLHLLLPTDERKRRRYRGGHLLGGRQPHPAGPHATSGSGAGAVRGRKLSQ
ncbi:MAG: hypothetical protein KatS3mg105_3798 [Gemmatales bacterium]|nr:MAG: hypothetical protein KatS3mg105_3798 [Gemmatales bacterium]